MSKTICDVVFTGETVLELGCGSGLPGIFAMKYLEAKCAYFVDFNTTVRMLSLSSTVAQ